MQQQSLIPAGWVGEMLHMTWRSAAAAKAAAASWQTRVAVLTPWHVEMNMVEVLQ
jgi:hypothetical protein